MATTTVLQQRLTFRQTALSALYTAYTALISGGVKSYTIGERELTRFDLDTLKDEITALEKECDELQSQINGTGRRKAFGILPRDF